jgi:hypothetical protein
VWPFFGTPEKKKCFFENRNTRRYFWRKTGKNPGEKTKKNRYFTKIESYLYKFVANESRFGIYTRKTKEVLSRKRV